MKSYILLLGISLLLITNSCKKINSIGTISYGCTDPMSIYFDSNATQDDGSCIYPVVEKRVLVFEGTGQLCMPCGKYGVPISDSLLKLYPKTELVAVHFNDNFQNQKLDSIKKTLNIGGIPSFIVGMDHLNSDLKLVFNRVRDELNRVPDVQVVSEFLIQGNTMTIDVKTLKNKKPNREYNVAVYILEDNQVGPQAGVKNPPSSGFVHHHVLRKVLGERTYGIPLKYSGVVSSNQFTVNLADIYSTDEQPLVPSNCYPVVVIWEKRIYGFEFVNVTS